METYSLMVMEIEDQSQGAERAALPLEPGGVAGAGGGAFLAS